MDSLALRVAARYKGKKRLDTGTVVYQYSERQVARRNAEKAKRLEKLRGSIDSLRSQVRKDLKSSDPDKFLTALAVALIDETYERVGNEESAEEGHFGVTGWQRDHIKFSNGKATISYIGKSGVKQKKVVSDPTIVKALRDAAEGCDGDCIFEHAGGKVDSKKVNTYLKKFDITAKDLRGFHANDVMKANLKEQRKGKLPEDKKEREEQLKKEYDKALEETAKAVGHEAKTLNSQYLVPGLEDAYKKDGTVLEKMVKEAAARLKPIDKQVIEAFVKKQPLGDDRAWVESDGRSLYKLGMGGEKFAVWRGPQIAVVSTMSVKSDEVILRYLKKVAPKNSVTFGELKFQTGGDSLYRDQWDGWIVAYIPGRSKPVGRLDWSEFQGKYQIKMVEVDPEFRRSGIATALYRKLFKDQGITKRDLGPSTKSPEGDAFRRYAPIAQRIVARYREAAEVLSKEWLMGVRRGWLQAMSPPISDYADVLKAHTTLEQFIERLRDQVLYIRRGPYTSLLESKERKKLEAAFDQLLKAISDSRSRALHWKEWLDGTALGLQWGEDRTEDAKKMLDLYKRDFAEATGTSIEMRGRRWKAVSLTDLMDKVLKILRDEVKVVREHDELWEGRGEKYTPPEPAYKEFDLGGMKVVIDDRKVTANEIQQYIKHLDIAHRLLKKKGFGKLWYGEVFIECEKCGGENPYGAELGVGGHYRIGPNTIAIYSRPSKHIVTLMIHELGHRWWFKHMTRENRLRFEDWVAEGLAPVSAYGSKHHHEAFAEAFMHYIMGKPMTPQQVETFKLVALGRRFSAAAPAGWTEQKGTTGRSFWTRADGKVQILDAKGRPGTQRYLVVYLQGGKRLEDIGWPSLKAAIDYVEGRRTLRDHPLHRVAGLFMARTRLSRPLQQAAKDMKGGSWGKAKEALTAVLKALDVAERPGEIGTIRTISADWYYSLGPRQQARAKEIVQTVAHMLRWVGDDSVAERMAPQMEALAKEVAWLEPLAEAPEASFQHGPFEIVPMPGVNRQKVNEALEALDGASKALRSKFPQVLYGKVFVTKTLPRSHVGIVAHYVDDAVYLSVKARGTTGDVYALCHEFGHRYEKKFWRDKKQRDEFWKLSTSPKYETLSFDAKLRRKLADEFIHIMNERRAGRSVNQSEMLEAWLKHRMTKEFATLRDLSQKALAGDEKAEKDLHKLVLGDKDVEVQTDNIVQQPLHVTPYGAKSWTENFAEAFAHYALGKQLPAEIAAIMGSLGGSKSARLFLARTVRVLVDRDKTLAARKKWPSLNETIVGTFDQSLALYRVFDETELKHIAATGRITGGKYSVPAERAHGASWGHDITAVINMGNQLRGRRLGDHIYLAKIDGFDYEFAHLGPGIELDPNGPPKQPAKMDPAKCNPGLGCSIFVDAADVDAFYRVQPNGQIEALSQAELKAEAERVEKKPEAEPEKDEYIREGFDLKPKDKFVVEKGSTKLGVGIRNTGLVRDVWQKRKDLEGRDYRVWVKLWFRYPIQPYGRRSNSNTLTLYASHPNRLKSREVTLMDSAGNKIIIGKRP